MDILTSQNFGDSHFFGKICSTCHLLFRVAHFPVPCESVLSMEEAKSKATLFDCCTQKCFKVWIGETFGKKLLGNTLFVKAYVLYKPEWL